MSPGSNRCYNTDFNHEKHFNPILIIEKIQHCDVNVIYFKRNIDLNQGKLRIITLLRNGFCGEFIEHEIERTYCHKDMSMYLRKLIYLGYTLIDMTEEL